MATLSTYYPAPITAADLGLGPASNATFGSIQDTPIGNTTPNTGAFTTLTANGSGSADLVAEFGTPTDGLNNIIQIWGNGTGRNHVIGANVSTGVFFRVANGSNHSFLSTSGIFTGSGLAFGWSSTGNANGSADVTISRDAADTVAQRRSTNPQTFRLYNTYTDASNYERGFMRWNTNVLQIGAEAAGTGSARNLEFQTGGTSYWQLDTSGRLRPVGEPGGSGFRLASGWLCWQQGSTNHFAFVDGNITARSAGAFQWSGTTDAGNFSGDWLRLSRSAGGCLLLSAGTSTAHRFQFGGTTSSFPALKRSSTTLQARLADDTDFAPFECGALTLNGNLTASTRDIVTDTTTGTRIGTGTTQLLGFWNAAPSAQPAAVADATDAASTQDRLNDLLARLRTIGIIAT